MLLQVNKSFSMIRKKFFVMMARFIDMMLAK